MDLMQTIGKRIFRARKKSKLTQEQLAVLVHCRQAVISNYEKGNRGNKRANPELICKIAKALNVPFEWLLFGTK